MKKNNTETNPPFFNSVKRMLKNIRGQNLKMLAFQKIGVNNVDKFYWYMNV